MAIKFSPERWQQIQHVLDQLLELEPEQQQREAQRLCSDDTALLSEVQELLQHHFDSPAFLEQPAMDMFATDVQLSTQQAVEIEGYTFCERLGVGGMGVVYRAERDQGDFTQQVAIKFLPESHNKSKLRERFRQEQQLLADLEHPNIAKLFGGGLSSEGQPYLIMEYVAGEPIDEYCRHQNLGVHARLRLVQQVAVALAHAHSRLTVHRDIKPSNILVNNDGDIKLLDFGIAKLIGDIDPNLTRTEEQVMTPGFAAPEQVQNQAITAATDIYQLGLVAYLLLTGKQAHQEHSISVSAMVKAICEETPTTPSVLVSRSKGVSDATDVPTEWSKWLKGDLDAIVLTMLRTRAHDRYASMSAVIADIDAYFEYRPISSLSQSSAYQIRKWLRRYRAAVAVASVFFIMLGAYAITTSLQASRIRQALDQSIAERQRAESVADFMVDMFKAADPNVAGIETITAQQLLEQGLLKIDKDLSASPAIQAKMLTSIGDIFYSQGQIEKSRSALELALQKQEMVSDANELDLAQTLTNLAVIYNETGDHKEAEGLYKESLSLQQNYNSSATPADLYAANLAETNNGYAALLMVRGELGPAENYIQEAIRLLDQANLGEHEQYANSLSSLAVIRITQGQLQEASTYMQDVISLQEKTTGETHPFFSLYLVSLANVLIKLEQLEQAKPHIDRAISLQLQILDANHPDLANSKRNLGVLLHHQGDLAGAEREFRQALAIREANFSAPSFMTATTYLQLADVLIDLQRFQEAGQLLEKMRTHHTAIEAGKASVGLGLCSRALLAYRQGRFLDASELYSQAIGMLSSSPLRLAIAKLGYAQSLLMQGDYALALEYAKHAMEIRANKLPKNHSLIAEAEVVYGLTLAANKQVQQGREFLSRGLPTIKQRPRYHYGEQSSVISAAQKQLSSKALYK